MERKVKISCSIWPWYCIGTESKTPIHRSMNPTNTGCTSADGIQSHPVMSIENANEILPSQVITTDENR